MQERILRIRAVLALLIFTVFSILWTSLVLPLSAPPLSLSHTAIGAFGLAGVAGALAAAQAGRARRSRFRSVDHRHRTDPVAPIMAANQLYRTLSARIDRWHSPP